MSNTLLAAKPVLPAPAVRVHHCPRISLHNLGWLAHIGGEGRGQTATHTGQTTLASWQTQILSPFEGAANTPGPGREAESRPDTDTDNHTHTHIKLIQKQTRPQDSITES